MLTGNGFYNLAPHSSLKEKSPQDRFFSEPEKIRRLDMQRIEESFLLELEGSITAVYDYTPAVTVDTDDPLQRFGYLKVEGTSW